MVLGSSPVAVTVYGSLWFYSKDEATKFIAAVKEDIIFMSFMYRTKLVGETEAQPTLNSNNVIFKNWTVAVPLKYLSKFWRSLEIPLINCKAELKSKWANNCVLAAAGIDNIKANDNIIFTIKDTKLYVPVVILSAKDNQKLSESFSEGSEISKYSNEWNRKVRTKIREVSTDLFSNQTS